MSDNLGKEIVQLRDREKANQANFRSLWQDISDMGVPFTFQITGSQVAGAVLMRNIYDVTMMEEGENMASGLSNFIMPPGQKYFIVQAEDRRIQALQHVRRYFGMATEALHEELANSNFLQQTDMSLLMWLQFGMAAQYSEWTVKTGLNFRDYGIGMWQCMENAQGIIDTIILTIEKTARQCVQEFKIENVGESIQKAYEKEETRNDKFNIIQVIRPREDREYGMLNAKNMPYQSVYVAEADEHTIEEGGYPEFPFAVPRYRVIFGEVYGRGQGAIALRAARTLNRATKNYDEATERWVKPPLEVLESFDGDVDISPDAINHVVELGTIKGIDFSARGQMPLGKDWIEYRTQRLQQIYFKNTFEQLSQLTGDRRTTVEIYERIREGLRKLSKPIGRLFTEFFDVQISRSFLLLIRNGVLPPPPPELSQGGRFKIEYIGPLALALRDQQTRALERYIVSLGEMEPIYPGVKDNLDYDKAAFALGENLGVKTELLRSKYQIAQIRADRQKLAEAQMQAQMLEQGSKAYRNVKDKPEEGSPAEQVQKALVG